MAKRKTLIENAKKYLGVPYVWGGDSFDPNHPNDPKYSEGGFDCSGYMFNVMKDSGMKVGRSTAQGYSSKGTEVSRKNMKEGDLLFFGKSLKSITHIAMYAGDNKMYESIGGSRNTIKNKGKGVTLSSLSRRSDLVLVKKIADETDPAPKKDYYPKYTGKSISIVDALKAVGEKDTSLTHRKKIGEKNGIKAGSAEANEKMLKLLKAGKLTKA